MHFVPVVNITDPADDRVADYLCLTDVDLRTKFEPPRGLFIAEGELVIRRAMRAGYRLRSALLGPEWVSSLPALNLSPDTPTYVAGAEVLKAITGFRVHRGVLASVHRRALPAGAALLAGARRVAVLEDVNTHTNVGAIFRCAAALGMDAVLLSPACADPLYRRAVRVSMGEVFAVPYARLEAWPADVDRIRAAGFRLLGLTPDLAATPLADLRLTAGERVALLLGAEGPGLSSATLARVEGVRIPMSGGVDSLNVAAAAAVAFYVVGQR